MSDEKQVKESMTDEEIMNMTDEQLFEQEREIAQQISKAISEIRFERVRVEVLHGAIGRVLASSFRMVPADHRNEMVASFCCLLAMEALRECDCENCRENAANLESTTIKEKLH